MYKPTDEPLDIWYANQLVQGENLPLEGNVVKGQLSYLPIVLGSVVITIRHENDVLHQINLPPESKQIDHKTGRIRLVVDGAILLGSIATADYEYSLT